MCWLLSCCSSLPHPLRVFLLLSSAGSSLPQVLGLRSSLQLKMINHQALAVVFQLEYVFSAPVGRETMVRETHKNTNTHIKSRSQSLPGVYPKPGPSLKPLSTDCSLWGFTVTDVETLQRTLSSSCLSSLTTPSHLSLSILWVVWDWSESQREWIWSWWFNSDPPSPLIFPVAHAEVLLCFWLFPWNNPFPRSWDVVCPKLDIHCRLTFDYIFELHDLF